MKYMTYISLFSVLIYYVLSLISILNILPVSNSYTLFPFLFQKSVASQLLKLDNRNDRFFPNNILFFFKKDSEILSEICTYGKEKNENKYTRECIDSIQYDKKNLKNIQSFITKLSNSYSPSEIGNYLNKISLLYYSRTLPFTDSQTIETFTPSFFAELPNQTATVEEYMAQIYYFIGLKLLGIDVNKTLLFWIAARDLAPNWGYFHVELASLYYYKLQNKELANHTLSTCQTNIFSSELCKITLLHIDSLESPGAIQRSIRAIPNLTD